MYVPVDLKAQRSRLATEREDGLRPGGGPKSTKRADTVRVEVMLRADLTLSHFNVQPARSENGLFRRGCENPPMRGLTAGTWRP